MLDNLQGKEVAIHFIDGTQLIGGTIVEVDDRFVKYLTEYQEHYIPISSIRSIAIDTKERQRPRVGFGI